MNNQATIACWLREQHNAKTIKVPRFNDIEEMATDLASRLNGSTSASLNTTAGAKAASHLLRREILRVLWTTGKDSPKEIALALDGSLGVVSYHVRMLADYGAVEVSRTEPRRGALQHYYRLTEDGRQLCLELFGPNPAS